MSSAAVAFRDESNPTDELIREVLRGTDDAMKRFGLHVARLLRSEGIERPSELVIYGGIWRELDRYIVRHRTYVPTFVARNTRLGARYGVEHQSAPELVADIIPRAMGPRHPESETL